MLHELGDDNHKSTFDCTIYNRVTGIAILRHMISYLSALDLTACYFNKVKEVIKCTAFKENLYAFVTALYNVYNDQLTEGFSQCSEQYSEQFQSMFLIVLNIHLSFIQIV